MNDLNKKNNKGASLVEVLLSLALFVIIITLFVGLLISGQEESAISADHLSATALVREGIEAVRNIRDENFSNLTDGDHGLNINNNEWELSGNSDSYGKFTRVVSISSVDVDTKEIESVVTWSKNLLRNGEMILSTRLTNWQEVAGMAQTCNDFVIDQGYTNGTCRPNSNQCSNNDEDYVSGGDQYCPGTGGQNVCCALPSSGGGGENPINSCNDLALDQGYTSGTCRQNSNRCNQSGEDYVSDGDQYCPGTGGQNVCCVLP